jgi:TetR/AcrR family transcriptional regulator, regulator of cefoperazone and chloramphenicol sensitivity
MRSATAAEQDLTARARIRDAAIARFAADGVPATTIRAIAEAADVSPALVSHHYGTNDALRAACDEYVVAYIREQKLAAMGEGPSLDPLAALQREDEGPPVMRYLARTLVDASPQVVALVDGMVETATAALEEGVRSGLLEPTEHPRELAALLTVWSLGALTLHAHTARLLGVDLQGPAERRGPYVRIATEALRGIFTDEAYDNIQRALAGAPDQGDDRA